MSHCQLIYYLRSFQADELTKEDFKGSKVRQLALGLYLLYLWINSIHLLLLYVSLFSHLLWETNYKLVGLK